MSAQLSLLDPSPPDVSRQPFNGFPPHENVETSFAAAAAIQPDAATLRARCLSAITAHGDHGATDDELEGQLHMLHQTLSARRRELVLLDLIIDSGLRRKTRSGRAAIVWKVSI